jgi:hypothetical protein
MVFPLPREVFLLPQSSLDRDGVGVFDVDESLGALPEPIVLPSSGATFEPEECQDWTAGPMKRVILEERQ